MNVEELAEIIADAFGPAFALAASRPDKPFRTPVPYHDMPEKSKDIFRVVATAVVDRRKEWA